MATNDTIFIFDLNFHRDTKDSFYRHGNDMIHGEIKVSFFSHIPILFSLKSSSWVILYI